MSITIECKSENCDAIFSSSFSLDKPESVCQFKQDQKFKQSDPR